MIQNPSKKTNIPCFTVSFLLSIIAVVLFSFVFFACAPQIMGKGGTDPALNLEIPSPEAYYEKGVLNFKKGDFEAAIKNWTQSEALYKNIGKPEKQCMVWIELSRAYQAIGLSSQALDVLEKALKLAEKSENKYHQASVLTHLGNLYTIMGNEDLAENYLTRSLFISNTLDAPELSAAILNNQGNLYLYKKNYGTAVQAYTESIKISKNGSNPLLTITSQINCARACMKNDQAGIARELLKEAMKNLNLLEDSNFKSYGLMNIGLAYSDLGNQLPNSEDGFKTNCNEIFTQALGLAQRTGDHRAMSYAFGYTGKLYEDAHRYEEALVLTQKAVFAAQQVYAPESLYKWQWQTGRILKRMNNVGEAVAAYRRTVFTLQSIRMEIDNCHDIQQASFRKIAGAICFELVDLLLQQNKFVKDQEKHESLLLEARDLVELLRVYELRNYFKDDCVDAAGFHSVNLESISETAVVIYPIQLEDRMELLVSLPSGLKQFTIQVDQETMTREIREFRRKIEKRTTWEFLPHAQKLYHYLIRPLEPDLFAIKADTLVFVPSGPLRTVPIAALHDGKEFLIHKYATAITPGLNLIDPAPIKRKGINILSAGITQTSLGFPPLPEVATELENISRLFPSKQLLNQDFSISNMETELKKDEFNIVHIASHGQFQADVDQTFVLAFNEKLTMNTLDKYAGFLQFRKIPLDLLTLSACESAAGDDLAALGMAGVAVKAGARSALATLWSISDMASSILINQFYLQIKDPSVSRAMALQQAQLSLLEDPRYGHPGYWSPFLLINNWL